MTAHDTNGTARFLPRWEVGDVTGAVVAIDVIRAFSTAAYTFGAGAEAIYLVAEIDEALTLKANRRDLLAMGESHGRRIDGFDFSNSPVEVAAQDLAGRTLVQRTSAGTAGVVAARSATRLWCASLVCASATAAALNDASLGAPTYVITGRFEDHAERPADDDVATAELIERARLGQALDQDATAHRVSRSDEARPALRDRCRTLPPGRHHLRDTGRSVRLRDEARREPLRVVPTKGRVARARSGADANLIEVQGEPFGHGQHLFERRRRGLLLCLTQQAIHERVVVAGSWWNNASRRTPASRRCATRSRRCSDPNAL